MKISPKHTFCSLSIVASLFVAFPAWAEDEQKPATQPARKPTEANVAYGKHSKQVVDFYKAESSKPTPVVVFIHGGGWRRGSKENVAVEPFLTEGVSVVAVEYRFINEATAEGVVPPVKGPLLDAARAIQFVRSKAREWNIAPERLGATGSSAGACSSLWLAFHDDLADVKADDPVARESTRLHCAAVVRPQTTLDPRQMKEWTPNSKYGGHAFGFAADESKNLSEFAVFLAGREKILPWIKEYSPYELVTSDDPPIALFYEGPPKMGQEQRDPTHTTNFGFGLKQKCDAVGVECLLVHRGATKGKYETAADFLLARLKEPK